MKPEFYIHKTVIKVRYADLDTYGHVNNKAFLSYLEEARISYMQNLYNKPLDISNFGSVVGRIDITYIAPIFLFDKIFVLTRCSYIGKKSFELRHLIIKETANGNITAAKAIVTMISYDLKKGKSVENSPEMINAILNYEKIKPTLKD